MEATDDRLEHTEMPAAISADSFASASALIALITNAQQCSGRLQQLRAAQADAEDARRRLADERTGLMQERAAIETDRAAVEKDKVALHIAKNDFAKMAAEARKIVDEQRRIENLKRYRPIGPGGLVQDFVPGYPTGETVDAVPEFNTNADDFAPIAGSTLTREPVTRRRPGRPRRQAEP
jgi:hypothetical protein